MTGPVSPHDPLCPSVDDRYLPMRPACQCPLIERVKEREGERYGFPLTEAEIRADERERLLSGVQWRHSVGERSWSVECLTDRDAECPGCLCYCHVEKAAIARFSDELRTKVEALHGLAPSTYWDDALDEVVDMIADEDKR